MVGAKVRVSNGSEDLVCLERGGNEFTIEAKGGISAKYAANVRDYLVGVIKKKFEELFNSDKFHYLNVEFKEFGKGDTVSMKLENRINILGEEELVVKTINAGKEENDFVFIGDEIVSEKSEKGKADFVMGQLEAILKKL